MLSKAYYDDVFENEQHPVLLFSLPLFHLFGFFPMRAMTMGETPVLMERFDFERDVEVEERLLVMGFWIWESL